MSKFQYDDEGVPDRAGKSYVETACRKRGYRSQEAGRRALRLAGFRARVYYCFDCAHWHITNQEKRY